MSPPPLLVTALTHRRTAGRAVRCALFVALAAIGVPLLIVLSTLMLFAGSPEVNCQSAGAGAAVDGVTTETANPPAGLTTRQRELFAAPLQLQPGRWHSAGATYYSVDTDPRGAIPDPNQADLTRHPDTFAELSLKTVNAGITYDTANALGRLPWMTALRVAYRGKSVLVYKRDIGYGQGAATINGHRYRIDLFGPAARALGTTSSLVQLQLAPRTGAGNTVGDTPDATSLPGTAAESAACATPETSGSGPLPLTPGERAKLLPNGQAAAPQNAPDAVKKIIAAGNRLVGKPYLLGGGHGLPLSQIAAAYDCSSSISHLLYGARLVDVNYTPASGTMAASYGQPGYGKWVSLLANAEHVYMYVAGLRWDTHRYGSGDRGVAGIGWHTNRRPDTGFTARHPQGL